MVAMSLAPKPKISAETRIRLLAMIPEAVQRMGFCQVTTDILPDLFPAEPRNRDVEFLTGVMYTLEGKRIPDPAPTTQEQWQRFLAENSLQAEEMPDKPGMLWVWPA